MRSLNIAMLATAAVAALTTATVAADPIIMVDTPPAPMYSAVGLDGPYAGLFVLGSTGPSAVGVGIALGVNMSSDGLIYGVEGDLAWLSSNTWDAQVHGKLGVMASSSAAIFGIAGLGFSSANGTYVPLGVGAEFAIADNMSLAASAEYDWNLGGGVSPIVGKVGLNFHF